MAARGSVPYDAAAVAAAARQADPSLAGPEADRLAGAARDALRTAGCDDVAAVARTLLAVDPHPEVSHANVVARAAVDFCAAHDVDLT